MGSFSLAKFGIVPTNTKTMAQIMVKTKTKTRIDKSDDEAGQQLRFGREGRKSNRTNRKTNTNTVTITKTRTNMKMKMANQ